MTQLIDTHSHLYLNKFKDDLDEVIARAEEVNSHVFLPNIDEESISSMNALRERNPAFFYPMMGLHPCSVKEEYQPVLDRMEKRFSEEQYYGVGETGLDYYWDKTYVEQQKAALRVHIEWAKDLAQPLILHCRDSMEDVIQLVSEGQDGRLRGIFHCFNGTAEQAQKVTDMGFMIGIGGVVTYKKAEDVREVVAETGLEHIVLETDSPYLPPVPYRGKRNESSYVQYVAEKVAEVKNIPVADVAVFTSRNALRMFGIDQKVAQ